MASVRVMRSLVVVLLLGVCGLVKAQQIANFENLALEKGSYWNGSDGSGGFASGSARFSNYYESGQDWDYWDGFSYSNITDTAVGDTAGQFNAITGGGQGGSANYAVGFVGFYGTLPTMVLDEPTIVSGLYVTNNNYAYYSMLNGDAFTRYRPFGGKSGNDADWFLLSMTGKDATGAITGTVNFYLADYRFVNNQQDYIVNSWQFVNLASLGVVKSVEFNVNSSDPGTPTYFVIDTVVPEPASLALLTFAGMIGLRRRKD